MSSRRVDLGRCPFCGGHMHADLKRQTVRHTIPVCPDLSAGSPRALAHLQAVNAKLPKTKQLDLFAR